MKINLLLILVAALGLWRAWRGLRNGFINEMNRLISLAAALFVLVMAVTAVFSFMEKDNKNGIIAIILLLMTGILLHMLGIVLKALRAIAGLPFINLLNACLGMAVGLAETVAALWLLYCMIQWFPDLLPGEQIMKWTAENEWLMKLYEADFFFHLGRPPIGKI